jgi:DNA repair exonuclease SbcCD ATPase subunit
LLEKKPISLASGKSDGQLAQTATLNDAGYKSIAKLRSYSVMEAYMKRVIKKLGFTIVQDGGLEGLIPFYSGQKTTQNFGAMTRELLELSKKPGSWLAPDNGESSPDDSANSANEAGPTSLEGDDAEDSDDESGINQQVLNLANMTNISLQQLWKEIGHAQKSFKGDIAVLKESSENRSNDFAQVMTQAMEGLKKEREAMKQRKKEREKEDSEQQQNIDDIRKAEEELAKKLKENVASLEDRIFEEQRNLRKKLKQAVQEFEEKEEKPHSSSLTQDVHKVYEPLQRELNELRQSVFNETSERQIQFRQLQHRLNWLSPMSTEKGEASLSLTNGANGVKSALLNLDSDDPDLEVSGDGMLVPLTPAGFAAVAALRSHQATQLQIELRSKSVVAGSSQSSSEQEELYSEIQPKLPKKEFNALKSSALYGPAKNNALIGPAKNKADQHGKESKSSVAKKPHTSHADALSKSLGQLTSQLGSLSSKWP